MAQYVLEARCHPHEAGDVTAARKSRPYVMRGAPIPTAARATIADIPDRRIDEVYPRKLDKEEIALINRVRETDPRLRAIDRCFFRWAATPSQSNGPRLSHIILLRQHDSGPVPLDDAESKMVDVAVRTSPGWARNFVRLWYKTDSSVAEIATVLKIKRREYVYDERKLVLGYYLGRLAEAVQLHL
jgi:hypothetical protein